VQLLEFIASRLRDLRHRHDLTQEQMATLLKTDLRWYQRVEAGEKDIRASTIDRLGAVFGLSGPELMAKDLPKTKVTAKPQPTPHRPRKATRAKSGRKAS